MIKIEAIGNLGKDAEQKTIGGNTYASFSIAVTKRVKGENKTIWYNVMKSDKDGKLTPYLVKGMKVFVSGEPTLSAYISKNTGNAIAELTIWANELEFCSSGDKQSQPTQQPAQRAGLDNFPAQTPDDEDQLPF